MRLHAELFSYRLRYLQPVSWSDVREDAADYVLLKLTDADGHVGLAEATVKPTWSGHTIGSMLATLREVLLPRLTAADLRQRLRQVPEQMQARGLVESALATLDLVAAGASAAAARSVAVSCTLTRQPPDAMAQQAARLHERHGVTRFKVKGGQGLAVDADAVRAVGAAVPGAVVQVDANSAYDAARLVEHAESLRDAGAVLLEDPCPFGFTDFAGLARRSALPLLVDLAARDADAAAHFAAHGAAAISVKPGRYGAVESRAVADAARAAGAAVGLGLFGESDLGAALNLHLVPDGHAGADTLPAELTGHLMLAERLLDGGFEPRHGCLALPALAEVIARVDWSRMTPHAH